MDVDSSFIKMLMEIGFMATNSGRLNEAEAIFMGLSQVRPHSSYPQIGLGCVAMGRGDFVRAIDLLNGAPTKEKIERDLCQGFLGMALKLGGYDEECRTVLNKLLIEGENEAAVRMAGKLLDKL